MKVLIAGPSETSALRASLGLKLVGAPKGTAQTPIAPLAAALRRRGIEVHIVLTDPTLDKVFRIEEDGCIVEYVPLRGEPRYRARSRSKDLFEVEIQALTKTYQAAAPDLIHAHWTYEFAEAAVRSGLPHLVTMHDIGWVNVVMYRNLYRVIRLIMMLRVMPRIQYLSIVAPFMYKWARLHGYFGHIDVVPNGVDIPDAKRGSKAIIGQRPFRIVSIGDQTRRKNIFASIAALRIIRSVFGDAELHLFGPGLTCSFVQDELGVIPHDKISHPELMRFLDERATLLIHPSRQETFGVILSEAMARGVPVIAGKNSGGISFVTDQGRAAHLVDVTNPFQIATAAVKLLSDQSEFDRLSRIGRERVAAQFGIDTVALKYIEIYERILQMSHLKSRDPQ